MAARALGIHLHFMEFNGGGGALASPCGGETDVVKKILDFLLAYSEQHKYYEDLSEALRDEVAVLLPYEFPPPPLGRLRASIHHYVRLHPLLVGTGPHLEEVSQHLPSSLKFQSFLETHCSQLY